MRSLTFLVVLIFLIISSVQARSLENNEPNLRTLRNYFIESPSYSNLLALLKKSQRKFDENDDNIYQDIDDIYPRKSEQSIPRPSNHRNRLSNSYGRKSHWDTYFG